MDSSQDIALHIPGCTKTNIVTYLTHRTSRPINQKIISKALKAEKKCTNESEMARIPFNLIAFYHGLFTTKDNCLQKTTIF